MKYSNCFSNKKMLLVFVCFSIPWCSFAQGPFDYDTPLGKRIYGQNVVSKELIIEPIEFGSEMTGYDGLTIVTSFNLLSSGGEQKLITFANSLHEKYLEVFYKENTVMFRRYYPGTTNYYDYLLYDQLFTDLTFRRNFDFRIYCTAFFFWIQVTAVDVGSGGGNFLSPVYFGLDAPDRSNMQELIDANSRARIVIGNRDNPDPLFAVHNVSAYTFHYEELKQDIYTRFSRRPATKIFE